MAKKEEHIRSRSRLNFITTSLGIFFKFSLKHRSIKFTPHAAVPLAALFSAATALMNFPWEGPSAKWVDACITGKAV